MFMDVLSYGIGTLVGFAAIVALVFVFISDITQKKHGVLRHVHYGVNPRGHATEIYDVVRRLKS